MVNPERIIRRAEEEAAAGAKVNSREQEEALLRHRQSEQARISELNRLTQSWLRAMIQADCPGAILILIEKKKIFGTVFEKSAGWTIATAVSRGPYKDETASLLLAIDGRLIHNGREYRYGEGKTHTGALYGRMTDTFENQVPSNLVRLAQEHGIDWAVRY